MPRDPKFRPTDPKFCGELESELRSGFRARNGELKGSGVLGTEGDNSPFRGARPKLTLYSDSLNPKHSSSHFWVPSVLLGRLTEPNSISARAGVAVPAGNRLGSVNLPKNTRGYQEMCGVGFRVRGIPI